MRIISGFHDYYDPLCKHDADRETLFIRKTTEAEPIEFPRIWFDNTCKIRLLCFAGKLIPHVEINIMHGGKWHAKVCWQRAKAKDHVEEYTTKANFRMLKRRAYGILRDIDRFFDWKPVNVYPNVPIWFATSEATTTDGYRTWKKRTLLNPRVMDVYPGFVKILPPAQAYQELVMWHGRMARPEPNVPEMSDADKIAGHGFDKFSFRKPKQ
jgi:hypothetical protein